ncbi:MAG: VanZ family protein [Armatimonadota bacterium]|nr:MAG: VanZ family protein [Armatimonadota bacterium]
MAVIFWLSSESSPVPGGFDVPDKVAHFGAYAILGSLVWWAAAPAGLAPAAALAIVIAGLYGASDEIHQRFVPGRFADLADWFADVAGAVAAAVILTVVARRRRPPSGVSRRRH